MSKVASKVFIAVPIGVRFFWLHRTKDFDSANRVLAGLLFEDAGSRWRVSLEMDRRRFLQASAAAVATGLLSGRYRELLAQKQGILGSREIAYLEFEQKRQCLATDYGRIAYLESEKGQPLLLLHGFPLNSFQWRGVIPWLSGQRRCIAPDFLGLGYTETSPAQSVVPDS